MLCSFNQVLDNDLIGKSSFGRVISNRECCAHVLKDEVVTPSRYVRIKGDISSSGLEDGDEGHN